MLLAAFLKNVSSFPLYFSRVIHFISWFTPQNCSSSVLHMFPQRFPFASHAVSRTPNIDGTLRSFSHCFAYPCSFSLSAFLFQLFTTSKPATFQRLAPPFFEFPSYVSNNRLLFVFVLFLFLSPFPFSDF